MWRTLMSLAKQTVNLIFSWKYKCSVWQTQNAQNIRTSQRNAYKFYKNVLYNGDSFGEQQISGNVV